GDAPSGAFGDVDVVEADRRVGDDLEPGRALEQLAPHRVPHGDECLGVGEFGGQLVDRRRVAGEHPYMSGMGTLQQVVGTRGDPSGDDDASHPASFADYRAATRTRRSRVTLAAAMLVRSA